MNRGRGRTLLSPEKARVALAAIDQWPVTILGRWPTPIERHSHPQLGELLVKRDDLAGFGRLGASGVKARKLEGFLGYLRQRPCDTLVLLLGNMTNLGHDIGRPLRDAGIRLKLLIIDDPPMPRSQREALFEDLIEDVEFLGQSRTAALSRMVAVTFSARLAGGRPCAFLPSPAHPAAVIGAARGFVEMVRQLQADGAPLPKVVYIAAAAGVTVAGLALAETLLRATGTAAIELRAVQVVPDPLHRYLPLLWTWTNRRLGLPMRLRPSNFEILRVPRNLTYGRFDSELERVCARVERSFELRLDPIYGGKSWSAMEATARQGAGSERRPVLFWHCGYSPDWPAFRGPE